MSGMATVSVSGSLTADKDANGNYPAFLERCRQKASNQFQSPYRLVVEVLVQDGALKCTVRSAAYKESDVKCNKSNVEYTAIFTRPAPAKKVRREIAARRPAPAVVDAEPVVKRAPDGADSKPLKLTQKRACIGRLCVPAGAWR